MTTNKNAFIQWYTKHHPNNFIRSLPRTPIVEIQAIPSGHPTEGHLDKNYVTCAVGSNVPLIGMQYTGQEEGHVFVFVGVDLDKATRLLQNPTPHKAPSSREGTGVRMPTSINAFTKWCERHNIKPTLQQRVANLDPYQMGLKGMVQSYYYTEFSTEELEALDKELNEPVRQGNGINVHLLDYVPHKVVSETSTLVLIKATGYNRKSNLLERALREALLFRTEKACIYYAELFLQRRVSHIDVTKIDWNKKPFYGIEIVQAEVKDEDNEVNNIVPTGSSPDFSYDF